MLRGPDTRLRLITLFLVAALLPLLAQLVRLQVLEHKRYHAEVETLVRRQVILPEPPWGVILDRHGDLLVGNTPVYDVGAEINLITDTVVAANLLAPLLNQPKNVVLDALTPPTTTEGLLWRPLARNVPQDAADEMREYGWNWLTLTPTWQRFYAEGALACHILGFVNQEGFGYGVQAFELRFLRGNDVNRIGEVSGDTNPLPDELIEGGLFPYPGADIRLTLDRTIQAYIEGELDSALQDYDAEGGTILVMNPRTGEILAMASRPYYEPYRYPDYAAEGQTDLFRDPAVSVPYEPGSVFKIVTLAAALDSGTATLDWSYYDKGILEYGGIVIHNASGAAYGQQNLQGMINHSLNVGTATLSTQVLGSENFYKYILAFGFGQTTGVELAGEAKGLVHLPDDWNWADSYLPTNSFGQGIAVTPLQMATAVAAVANDGVMMQPHIVAERRLPDGRNIIIPPHPIGHPISAETAHAVSAILARTIDDELTMASVPGYRVAGKTGTAQIPTTGGYESESVITSFVGYGPVPDPQVLILVKIDRPNVAVAMRWGTQTAAPVFQRVASRVFVLMGVPPSN